MANPNNPENLPTQKNALQKGLQKFQETNLSLDNMITQVGGAIAIAQQNMDLATAEFQKQVGQALKEGRITELEIMPVNAYVMPETSLKLKTSLSVLYPEEGGEPQISAEPLNAENATTEGSLDMATEISLTFKNTPEARDTPPGNRAAFNPESLTQTVENHWLTNFARKNTSACRTKSLFLEKERIWISADLSGSEPSYVATIDDRTGEIIDAAFHPFLPAPEKIAPVGEPKITGVEPAAAKSGEMITVKGDNFATLGGQTRILVDSVPIPVARLGMKSLSFKAPVHATRGDVEVITPIGSTGAAGNRLYIPLPSLFVPSPASGFYDALKKRGSVITVSGANLHEGADYFFSPGHPGGNVKILSPYLMQLEVTENAGTGPLYCTLDTHIDFTEKVFTKTPFISRVSPRQGCVGDIITITGNSLLEVKRIRIAQSVIERNECLLFSDTEIRFKLPSGAFDGRIGLQSGAANTESTIFSKDIFYVVPQITGFEKKVVMHGEIITLFGEGLDPSPDMMTLLFETPSGIAEADILEVSPDRKSFTCRVPVSAVTGYVMLIRKKIFSGLSAADTSHTAENKITILNINGVPADLICEERFGNDLSGFTSEAGSWKITNGMLEGFGRLACNNAVNLDTLSLYADVLNAKCFGYSLLLSTGEKIQLWVDLTKTPGELTWSKIDTAGIQTLLGGTTLPHSKNQNYLFELNVENQTAICLINQTEVSTQPLGPVTISSFALLAGELPAVTGEPVQIWDNVVALKKHNILALALPEFYRFGVPPEPPSYTEIAIDSFTPAKGVPKTIVKINGSGFDIDTRFFLGKTEAPVQKITAATAEIQVPEGGKNGPILVTGRGGVMSTSQDSFIYPPEILHLIPEKVFAGSTLLITGNNLPTEGAQVQIIDKLARVVSANSTSISVLVPDVVGQAPVSILHEGFIAKSGRPLEVMRRSIISDFLQESPAASWSTPFGALGFGAIQGETGALAMLRENIQLEDATTYAKALVLNPPKPAFGNLTGLFETATLPAGHLELRLVFGAVLKNAVYEGAPVEKSSALEIIFLEPGTLEPLGVLEKTFSYEDGIMEIYSLDISALSGKTGQFKWIISGSEVPLEAGFLQAEVIQLV